MVQPRPGMGSLPRLVALSSIVPWSEKPWTPMWAMWESTLINWRVGPRPRTKPQEAVRASCRRDMRRAKMWLAVMLMWNEAVLQIAQILLTRLILDLAHRNGGLFIQVKTHLVVPTEKMSGSFEASWVTFFVFLYVRIKQRFSRGRLARTRSRTRPLVEFFRGRGQDEARNFSLFLGLFEDETRNSSDFRPFSQPF